MTGYTKDNNLAKLCGVIVRDPVYSHSMQQEKIFEMVVSVNRLSGQLDEIPVTVSENTLPIAVKTGDYVALTGQLRSYNRHVPGERKLALSVFAGKLEVVGKQACGEENRIVLDGFLCRTPVYRKTPLGREIADMVLAVNRDRHRSDYLPCIAWGKNARTLAGLSVGTRLQVEGRMQSRAYVKRIGEKELDCVAYEVSVAKLTVVEAESK